MFLFVADDLIPEHPKLMIESTRPRTLPLAVVHPGFMRKQVGLKQLLKQTRNPLRAAISRRWERLTMRKA